MNKEYYLSKIEKYRATPFGLRNNAEFNKYLLEDIQIRQTSIQKLSIPKTKEDYQIALTECSKSDYVEDVLEKIAYNFITYKIYLRTKKDDETLRIESRREKISYENIKLMYLSETEKCIQKEELELIQLSIRKLLNKDYNNNIIAVFYEILTNDFRDLLRTSRKEMSLNKHVKSPEEVYLENNEQKIKQDILHTIYTMPLRRRQCYFFSEEDGLSNKEIAEKLGITQGAVRSHMFYIRQTLDKFKSKINDIKLESYKTRPYFEDNNIIEEDN